MKNGTPWYDACIDRDGERCVDCGVTILTHRLVVHHIDGSRRKLGRKYMNNNLDNLVVVCSPCHARRHGMFSKKQDILEMRSAGMTFTEIGEKLGLTRQRIQQLFRENTKEDKLALDSIKLML